MKKSVIAWHFVGDKLRNGQPVPPDGEWLEWTGPLVMCRSGLHASRDPWDALAYAPGPILCRVECDGTIIEHDDKLVCSHRKIIERRDATEGLRYFARAEALSVAHLWDPPDVVLEFLMTGDEELRSASWAASEAGEASRANWNLLVEEAFENT